MAKLFAELGAIGKAHAAPAGNTQETATPLQQDYAYFSSVPSGSGIIIRDSDIGDTFFIENADATNSLNIYPPVGASINGGVVNAPLTLLAGSSTIIACFSYKSYGATTASGGVLSIANGGTGRTSASAAFNALSPLTTQGDVLYGGTNGAGARLAIGGQGSILYAAGATPAPAWSSAAFYDTTLTQFRVGTNSPNDTAAFLAARALTDDLGPSGSHAFRDESTYNYSGSGSGLKSYCSFDSIYAVTGSAAFEHFNGYQGRFGFNHTGSVGSSKVYFSQPWFSSTGTLDTLTAFYAANPLLGAGATRPNNYSAIYIEQTNIASNNNFAINVVGNNPSYFGGAITTNSSVEIGTTLLLHGSATINASGNTIIYNDNNYAYGINIRNTNSGSGAVSGLSLQDIDGYGVGNFVYYGPNYANPSGRNSVSFLAAKSGTTPNNLIFSTASGGTAYGNISIEAGLAKSVYIRGDDTSGNIGLFVRDSSSWGSGVGCIAIGCATTNPTTNPSTWSGILYGDASTAQLHYRDPWGAVHSMIPPAISGYGTPTNGAKQSSFDASTITLPNLAACVAQLIVDLKSQGVLAA